ncbi:MAG TPA: HNH endonuclease signature motif containing protein, partial [Candidatus Binatia bacterium]|nr:HNH endonuclease signature motif containing protein [Candidatus Binatia bacterium]
DGLPIDVGRRRRMVSARLRRALESRDRFCRFPGRAVPARMTHAHHVRNWAAGGRTDLRNLVSLCGVPPPAAA